MIFDPTKIYRTDDMIYRWEQLPDGSWQTFLVLYVREVVMMVIRENDGTHSVINDNGSVIVSGLTNAQAWKRIDRLKGEAESQSQATADWSFNKGASGE